MNHDSSTPSSNCRILKTFKAHVLTFEFGATVALLKHACRLAAMLHILDIEMVMNYTSWVCAKCWSFGNIKCEK
jgi:hypothetical protein